MAQKYKLVERNNLGKDSHETPRKLYAIPKYNGHTDMNQLCKLISARSTASSGDVKAVLDSLNYVLDLELQAGRIVQLGELGNFRLSLSSEGAETEEGFKKSMLRKARIIFTPGESLKGTSESTTFAAYVPPKHKGAGSDGEDRPII